jgi:hypothetical protein
VDPNLKGAPHWKDARRFSEMAREAMKKKLLGNLDSQD